MPEISKYNSLSEWKSSNLSVYNIAFRNGYIIDICEKFGWKKGVWETKFCLVKKYINKHNMLPIKLNTKFKITQWCTIQRQKYRLNKLSKTKQKLLLSLKHWSFDEPSDVWENHYKQLEEYMKTHNRIPFKDKLGEWCDKQSELFISKNLSDYNIESLLKIKGWHWNITPTTSNWDYFYETFVEYMKSNKKFPDERIIYKNLKIGNWCYIQTYLANMNVLDIKYKKLLEKFPDWKRFKKQC